MDFKGEPSECAFHIGDKEVCSGTDMIQAMKRFLSEVGKPIPKHATEVVEKVKEVTKCDSEACIYKSSPFVQKIGPVVATDVAKQIFKPEGPAHTDGLLSNFNIDEVLEQFATKYPGFLHIPFQMRDFQEKQRELATTDFAAEYKRGMKTFGCVLNTDWYSGKGIHWYCIFGDFTSEPFTLEYYNTSGNNANYETKKWLSETKYKLAHDLGKQVNEIQVLNRAIQKNDVDCGVYCLHYIWSRLEGFPYSAFADPATAPNDDLMKQARQHLFIPDK